MSSRRTIRTHRGVARILLLTLWSAVGSILLPSGLSAQQQWKPVFTDLQNVLLDISCADSSVCLIAGTINWMGGLLVLRSDDGGRSFYKAGSDPRLVGLHFSDIQMVNSSYAYMKSDSGYIYSSSDGGFSWQQYGPLRNNGGMSEIVMLDSVTGYVMVLGTIDTIFRTSDGWKSWTSQPVVQPWPGELSGVKAFFADEAGLTSAVFNNDGMYLLGYTDGSDDWTFTSVPSDTLPMWSAIYRSEDEVWCWFRRRLIPDRIWYGNRVIRTTDRGQSWETVLDTVLADSVMIEQIAFGSSNDILLSSGSGPVRSTDNGKTWVLERIYDIPQFSSHHVEFPAGTKGIFFSSGLNDPTVYLPDGESSVYPSPTQYALAGTVQSGPVLATDFTVPLPSTFEQAGRVLIDLHSLEGTRILRTETDLTNGRVRLPSTLSAGTYGLVATSGDIRYSILVRIAR